MAGGANVVRNLNAWAGSKKMALEALAMVTAKQMEADARVNKSWTNRTGHARQGLVGGYFYDNDGLKVYIAHSVSYGIWLELKNDGKFAILRPTRDKYANIAFNQAKRILES